MIKIGRLNLNTSIEFRSWLAGLIDGEGNFSKYENKIRIVLEERDKFVLEYIIRTIGGKLYYRKPQKSWKPHWKPQWEYNISSNIECIQFTEWILPYLVLKKEVARQFLERIQ